MNKTVIENSTVELGQNFEKRCSIILEKNGFENVRTTNGSGDQGIDIIAYKHLVKYGIQCKYYTNPVGNHAIQEALAGKQYYDCHVAVVLTNSTFTQQAIDLANKTKVVLWDGTYLRKLEENAGLLNQDKNDRVINGYPTTEEEIDKLYEEIKTYVIEAQKASTALLQRRFGIGYNIAARLIDRLEANGVVGPAKGSVPREVLIKSINGINYGELRKQRNKELESRRNKLKSRKSGSKL